VSATTIQSPPAKAPAATPRRAYRPDIDGLRAIAILAVVLHHAGLRWIPGGYTGVDIFFVISGYLIGGQIYADIRSNSFSYLRFYQRRARRILPAFYAVLLFSIAASLVLLSPYELRLFSQDACAATLSASNIFFWKAANYFDARSSLRPLLMTWSLGVEEQFYLVIPLLIALLARLRQSLVLPFLIALCGLSLVLAAHDVRLVPMQAFYLLPDRAWELGVGVALAVFEFDRPPLRTSRPLTHLAGFIALALLLAPLVFLTPHSPFPGLAALPSVLGTALLIALPHSLINRKFLALAPLLFIGRVSYSWYLWHWPLLAFFNIATADALPLPAALFAVALAFVLAVLSWRFIEQPFRRSTTPAAPLLQRYAIASLAMLAVCAAIWFAHGLPQRYPDLVALEASASELATDNCLASRTETPNLSPACYPAPSTVPAPAPILALWGDSHAAAIAPALRVLAQSRGFAFAELAKNSCTPLIGAARVIPRLPPFGAACLQFDRATLTLIQSDPRVRIVVLAAAWSAPLERTWMDGWLAPEPQPGSVPVPTPEADLRLYQNALATTVRTLQSAGKQVILVDDAPSFALNPILLVRAAHIPARNALARTLTHPAGTIQIDPGFSLPESSPAIAAAQDLLRQLSRQLPVQLFDPKPFLCPTPTHCNYRDGETLLFIDSTHLSNAGATRALASFPLPPLTR